MHLLNYFRLKGFGSIIKGTPELKFLAAADGASSCFLPSKFKSDLNFEGLAKRLDDAHVCC